MKKLLYKIKRKVVIFAVNHMFCGIKNFELKRRMLISIGYEIGEGTNIVGPIFCDCKLSIGENCWIGKNLCINGDGSVTIGDNCDIAPDVAFQTGGHLVGDSYRRAGKGIINHITVGDGSWIGARSTIINNISIGSSCVVAACACVNKDIPDNCMVGGVPARIIRNL